MKIQVNSVNPYHTVIKELLYTHECDRLNGPLVKRLDKRNREYSKPQVPGKSTAEWTEIRVMKK